MKVDYSLIKDNYLFRSMSESDVSKFLIESNSYLKTFKKNDTIYKQNDTFENIGIVLKGCLILERYDTNGNRSLLDKICTGENFGEYNAVGHYPLNVSIVASEHCEVLFIPVNKFLRENILTSPTEIRFLQNLTLSVARQTSKLSKKLHDTIRRTTREKLTDYLSEQYHTSGKRKFIIPLNRQDLADFLFVDRSAMSSELGRMRDEGLIEYDRSEFKLLIEMPISDENIDPND